MILSKLEKLVFQIQEKTLSLLPLEDKNLLKTSL